MLAAQRREYLLEALRRDGKIVAKDTADLLGISEDSIRRDLRDLAAEGLCQRVYGGALPASPATAGLTRRATVSVAGKQQVASVAAALIPPGRHGDHRRRHHRARARACPPAHVDVHGDHPQPGDRRRTG